VPFIPCYNINFDSTQSLPSSARRKAMESLCGGKGPCSVYPDVSIGTQPVFAFLVNWDRAKGCLRASENVFANFFRFKKVSATAA